MTDQGIQDVLRPLVPQVLGALVRRYGRFDACEDAVQEALLAAAVQWPAQGVPANPVAWLQTVAVRRLTDDWRSESSRRNRETAFFVMDPDQIGARGQSAPDVAVAADDTLKLLFLCCHPALSAPSQVALTLRAVGGLTTAQIAAAFLVPESTMAQRISRGKQRIKAAGARFVMPPPAERAERQQAVLHVLYLVFNEGYTASSGPDLQRGDLTAEAIRLTRTLHLLLPGDGEVTGLLALMLLTDAHRAARTGPDGLVPLAEQDRSRWNRVEIDEGIELISDALRRSTPGPFQLQAAVAAVHAEAPRAQDTDWPQIVGLYRLLAHVAPNPMITLNHAAALAMVDGPLAGLTMLEALDDDERVAGHHRLAAVRAHLLELAGNCGAARLQYLQAARRTTSLPEKRYLESKAARLAR
jgi:predicted RNA polymerase sigma factor